MVQPIGPPPVPTSLKSGLIVSFGVWYRIYYYPCIPRSVTGLLIYEFRLYFALEVVNLLKSETPPIDEFVPVAVARLLTFFTNILLTLRCIVA